jgi:hypothetical protein
MSTAYLVSPSVAIVPLGAGILRTLHVDFHPICDGRELMSPDGRFIARATSTYGPHSFGGTNSYYEFVVESRSGARLQHFEFPVPRDELINWRLEGSITWADDGSCVAFEFGRKWVTLSVDC